MAENKNKFVVVRINEATRTRLKVKAAQKSKPLWKVIEELSRYE